jgi:outer membrane protein TolC
MPSVPRSMLRFLTLSGLLALVPACQMFVDAADKEVYALIEKRQRDALGESRPFRIDEERVPIGTGDTAYKFVPHPIDSDVPAAIRPSTASQPAGVAQSRVTATRPAEASVTDPGRDASAPIPPQPHETALTEPPDGVPSTQPSVEEYLAEGSTATTQPAAAGPEREILSLSEALAYAFRHSREFQFAKEDLYLAALALSLERFLWTPQFNGQVSSEYANYGQIRDFDHAMAAVAQVGVTQRLPLGGEITARVVDSLMRDLTHHVTTGETGAMILEANIPLLRGAGLVAYESRFQAERNLIYAVRRFETFRRDLAVEIAGDYFNLQQLRQEIVNAQESIKVFEQEVARATGLWRAGRLIQLEVQRADQDRLVAINRLVDAQEAYNTALDQFKIRLGMPTSVAVDVALPPDPESTVASETPEDEALNRALQMPDIAEEEANRIALKYRLDLINALDAIDDAARGVKIAENGLLPDLNLSGSVTMNTDPLSLGTLKYNTERTTWRGGIVLELPLNRKAEQVALRNSLIAKRRAERNYEQSKDLVVLQVRRAMRRVQQEQDSLSIQIANRNLAVERRRGARIRFQKGQVSNREVVDAENALLNARDRLAQAQSRIRLAILQFRRDTGTLRIDDDGRWYEPGEAPTPQLSSSSAAPGARKPVATPNQNG